MLKIGNEVYLSEEGIRCYVHEGVVHPDNPLWVKGVISADDIDGWMTLCVEWENGHRNYYWEMDLIKVTQEKPVVIGYEQIEYKGLKWDDDEFIAMSAKEMKFESEFDLSCGYVKSKFRPVYEVKK